MEKVEYLFIGIASRFTLTRSGSTRYSPIYGSNRTKYMWKQMTDDKLWQLYSNTWNHFSVCKKKRPQACLRMSPTKCVYKSYTGCPRGVMVKAMDCRIIVSEFVLQSHYYIHFQASTCGKGMNPLILLAMG